MSDDLSLDTKSQVRTPEQEVRRWLLEIKLAEKREKDWRKEGKPILETYRGTKKKKNSFNILWANTEVLRPALYNSTPKPDVRRRFRQKDVLGKAVSEVCERGLSYCVDAYDLDNCLQNDVLDALLPGRGLSRVRYVPIYKAKEGAKPTENAEVKEAQEAPHKEEAFEGDREEVDYEQALCEHVQWDDFLHGPGKTWEEVQWVAFRARLSKDDLIEKFGEDVAKEVKLDDVDDSDVTNKSNDDIKEVFKRAMLWEIWDKDSGKVFFLNESYKKDLIYAKDAKDGAPPLKLKNFFPVPRPLQLVEDTGTLIPTPLYSLYREQAEELDRLSARINKIINACRVRFVHDSTLTELKALMDAGDNEGIPSESARAWMANGGIEKAIWWMPIEQIAAVLRELYVARDAAKQVIYEITGISDIIRGATDPNETLGAQKLKANSSSLRLQRMQREVQRYTRDLIRLLGEVIGEEFGYQTLAKMTGLNFPTALQKQQAQLAMSVMQQNPQAVPPEKAQQLQQMLSMPSWEDIMGVLKNDMEREYRIDIETDSTVAESLQQDMEGLKEVLTAVVELWNGVAPAVQAGAVSMDAVKALTMVVVRRARMGLEVEDALESGMQQPKPESDPKAEAAKAKAEQDAQIAQRQQAHEEQIAQREAAMEQQRLAQEQAAEERRLQQEAYFEERRLEMEDAANRRQAEMDASFAKFKALLDSVTKVEVAEIGAEASVQAAKNKPTVTQ